MGQYDTVLGTLMLGIFFNTFLFGIASMQYVTYFNKRFDDSIYVKMGVISLLLNDTFQCSTMIYLAWVYSVENYTNPEILKTYFWPFNYVPIGTALVAMATHVLMTYRIYFMTKQKVVCCALLVLTVGALGLGVSYGAITFSSPQLGQRRTLKRIVAGWLGIQALLDMAIAGCLIFHLHRQRTKSTIANSVINRLIQGVMQTCLLPTTFAVAGLIAFVSSPKTSIFTMFIIPIGRAYTITLMDGLNVRAELKDKLLGDEEVKAANVIFSSSITMLHTLTLQKNLDGWTGMG
ncbi:hypothetical protein BJ165DRAFT_896656 [Panaeolus papilionaceus]|nr:hypothetical protein BJ165DRAFT_896656 [Panaeolus papilionaceus]